MLVFDDEKKLSVVWLLYVCSWIKNVIYKISKFDVVYFLKVID